MVKGKDKRADPRVPLRLKVAIVYHNHADAATRPTYHGLTHDISLSGLSVIVEYNVFTEDEVTVLLALPPANVGGKQKIVEASAKMVHTSYSSGHDAFRIGMQFTKFKKPGKDLLEEAIERRSVKFH